MVPNASDIARRRATALIVFRLLSSVVILIGGFILAIWIGVQLTDPSENEIAPLGVGIAVLALGAGAWFASGFAARLIIKAPTASTCPVCGYLLESLLEPRCTECGTVLTDEFMPGHVAPGSPRSGLGVLAGAQLAMSAALRLCAIPQALLAALLMGNAFVRLRDISRNLNDWYGPDDADRAWLMMGLGAAWMMIALTMVIAPSLWARSLLPARALARLGRDDRDTTAPTPAPRTAEPRPNEA